MDHKRSLSDSWQKNAANWTEAVRGGLIPSRKAGTDAAIVTAVTSRSPSRFLDVGCGEGWLVRRIARETGCAAIGIDGSERLIADARAADPESRYDVMTYRDLLEGKAALGKAFDVVSFNYALLDEEVTALLAAVADCLTDSGAIIVQTLHPWTASQGSDYRDGWRSEDFAAFETDGWTAMPWFFRTLESWHHAVGEAKLAVTEIIEPTAEPGGTPLSLLMVCKKRDDRAEQPIP